MAALERLQVQAPPLISDWWLCGYLVLSGGATCPGNVTADASSAHRQDMRDMSRHQGQPGTSTRKYLRFKLAAVGGVSGAPPLPLLPLGLDL